MRKLSDEDMRSPTNREMVKSLTRIYGLLQILRRKLPEYFPEVFSAENGIKSGKDFIANFALKDYVGDMTIDDFITVKEKLRRFNFHVFARQNYYLQRYPHMRRFFINCMKLEKYLGDQITVLTCGFIL